MATIASPAPYAALTPPLIADALDSVDVRGDGRLLALNSYENRVYQAWREDAPPVVVKFYRPARWSDAQILEEHAFVDELAEADVPVVAPLRLVGRTLHD
ncbi:MAG TPA: phosphotransferase, partial [Casimicrobiaceae bacterium]